jgi:hypothetical protein
VAGLFPKHAGAVLSTLSGAFQISGLVFLVLTHVSDSRKASFLGFAIFILGLTVMAALLLPARGSFVLEKDENETNVDDSNEITQEVPVDVPESNVSDPNTNGGKSDHNESEREGASVLLENIGERIDEPAAQDDSKEASHPTALQQLRSKEYLGLLIWFSICIVPLQYYVGTIGFQLEQKGDDGFYTNLFSITYAAAAVVAPLGGYLADTFSLGFAHGLATTLTAASLFILASPTSLNAQVVGLVCYGVGRMLTFGMYFSNVGKRFGYTNYGTLAGLGLITSAIISLLQYPLIAWASDGHEMPVNVACGAMLVAVLPYCYWLDRRERRYGMAPFFKHNVLTGG